MEKNVERVPERVSLDEKVEEALKDEHLEKIESNGTETLGATAIKNESEEMKDAAGFGEENEKFHSLPTTPLEIK
jgi:hypothetical protein